MGYRRVVTGHSPDGKAIVASDAEVGEVITNDLFPGFELRTLWAGDEAPAYPDDGSPPESTSWFPPVGGFRFFQFTVPPDGSEPPGDIDPDAAVAAMEAVAPGLMATMEPDNPGFHTSDTVDVLFVVSGSCVLELDDSATIELREGDTLVQSGTRHAWRNPGGEPCLLVGRLAGARRATS